MALTADFLFAAGPGAREKTNAEIVSALLETARYQRITLEAFVEAVSARGVSVALLVKASPLAQSLLAAALADGYTPRVDTAVGTIKDVMTNPPAPLTAAIDAVIASLRIRRIDDIAGESAPATITEADVALVREAFNTAWDAKVAERAHLQETAPEREAADNARLVAEREAAAAAQAATESGTIESV